LLEIIRDTVLLGITLQFGCGDYNCLKEKQILKPQKKQSVTFSNKQAGCCGNTTGRMEAWKD
jgi:hypothetical protein